jgi:hypothetical protein
MNNWNFFYDFMTHSISNGLWTDMYLDLFEFEINYNYNYVLNNWNTWDVIDGLCMISV